MLSWATVPLIDSPSCMHTTSPHSALPPCSAQASAPWLPEPRSRYAHGTLTSLGLPQWMPRLLSLPLTMVRSVGLHPGGPALNPPAESCGWPVVLFSPGLIGGVAYYSALCAEIASYGAIVLAVEHRDGSAAHTESASKRHQPYVRRRPAEYADEKAWRSAQVKQRVGELTSIVDGLSDVLSPTPVGRAEGQAGEREGGMWDVARLVLVGHSFGGGTVLECAAAMAMGSSAVRACACVALDPWMFGCSEALHSPQIAAARMPTLCLMTQSLMFPTNAESIRSALSNFARECEQGGRGASVVWAEPDGSRHEDASDFIVLFHPLLRLTQLAGKMPGRIALGRQMSATLGFLAHSGVQRLTGSKQQRKAREMFERLTEKGGDLAIMKTVDDHCFNEAAFILHGCKRFA